MSPSLPNDVLEEILSCLPVKSLGRSKCVCGSWYNLISDPVFINGLLKRLKEDQGNCSRLTFVHASKLYSARYEATDHQAEEISNYPKIFKNQPAESFLKVLASCKGLLCISGAEGVLYLWNPLTGESRLLPNSQIHPPPNCSSSKQSTVFLYGLVYNCRMEDFNLVRIVIFNGATIKTQVKMYSTTTKLWTPIQDFLYDFPHHSGDHGHWIVSIWSGPGHSYKISGLDLVEESYRSVQVPDFKHEGSYFNIGVIGKCLFLFCSSPRKPMVDLWVKKEYGNAESWTRISINIPSTTRCEAYGHLMPMCQTKKGEIILFWASERKLVVFYDKNNTRRYVTLRCVPEHA